jgi:hypothetical protein
MAEWNWLFCISQDFPFFCPGELGKMGGDLSWRWR